MFFLLFEVLTWHTALVLWNTVTGMTKVTTLDIPVTVCHKTKAVCQVRTSKRRKNITWHHLSHSCYCISQDQDGMSGQNFREKKNMTWHHLSHSCYCISQDQGSMSGQNFKEKKSMTWRHLSHSCYCISQDSLWSSDLSYCLVLVKSSNRND
jgi:hypothetical protein